MNLQKLSALLAVGMMLSTGCNYQRPFPAFSMGAARIAPPGTGTLQTNSVARAQNDYYNPGPGGTLTPPASGTQSNATANSQNGWHPVNGAAAGTSHHLSQQVPATVGSSPANNIAVASTTSTLATGNSSNAVRTPMDSPTGGMPINDATRVAAAPRTNLLSGTLEYTSRPGLPQYRVPGPPVVSSGNAVLATSTTGNQFSGPRFNGNPVNSYPPGGYPAGGSDWRARDPSASSRQ